MCLEFRFKNNSNKNKFIYNINSHFQKFHIYIHIAEFYLTVKIYKEGGETFKYKELLYLINEYQDIENLTDDII